MPVQQREYTFIDINKLKPSEYQSRTDLRESDLKELTDSIKSKGVIQPLIVRKKDDFFEIVAGSRRYYASKSLGLKELPVIIRELPDKDALIFSIIENLQRQDLNPIEEAQSFMRLMEEFSLPQEEVAKILGKDRTTIVNILRLLKLPDVIQEALRNGAINSSQGRTLLGLESQEDQLELFERLLTEKVSIRTLEETVRIKKRKETPFEPYLHEAEQSLQQSLGRKIKIVSRGKKGKVVIEYYSQQDLENLIRSLNRLREANNQQAGQETFP